MGSWLFCVNLVLCKFERVNISRVNLGSCKLGACKVERVRLSRVNVRNVSLGWRQNCDTVEVIQSENCDTATK